MGNQQQDHEQHKHAGHSPGHSQNPGHSHGSHSPGHSHGGSSQGHQHHNHDSATPDPAKEAALAELLELDAEVLRPYLTELMDWIGELTADAPPHRILDLGAGTGTGTRALLGQFGGAQVTAVDMSESMLERLTEKAEEAGIEGRRVRTVRADLDEGWPQGLSSFDLIWASASLHHMGDPDRSLTEVLAALRPGGLLIAVEMDSTPFPRFLPDDLGPGLGRPGLEARCHAGVEEMHRAGVPHLGDDWGVRLTRAGFAVEAERRFAVDLKAPLPDAVGSYAKGTLERLRTGLAESLDADDLAALDALLDGEGPHDIRRRDDLTVRTSRTVWVARRP
ncbi:class I SAM-dependent methyltransferase [Streptomyces sp. NPDC058657]|uniref:class I SAM-dependent methyltransferase n=1 Tax=unclassified Streptomyces TaxID=2593676 RepID=UPI00364B1C3E